jgi:hypothetical protein
MSSKLRRFNRNTGEVGGGKVLGREEFVKILAEFTFSAVTRKPFYHCTWSV